MEVLGFFVVMKEERKDVYDISCQQRQLPKASMLITCTTAMMSNDALSRKAGNSMMC